MTDEVKIAVNIYGKYYKLDIIKINLQMEEWERRDQWGDKIPPEIKVVGSRYEAIIEIDDVKKLADQKSSIIAIAHIDKWAIEEECEVFIKDIDKKIIEIYISGIAAKKLIKYQDNRFKEIEGIFKSLNK